MSIHEEMDLSECGTANITHATAHIQHTGESLLTIIFAGLIITNIIELYICCRQLKVLHTYTAVPRELKDNIDPETYENIRIYRIECEDFRMCCVIIRSFLAYLELHFHIVKKIWDFYSVRIKMYVNCCSRDRCTEQELYITTLFTVTMVLYHCLKDTVVQTFKVFILDKYYRYQWITTDDFVHEQFINFLTALWKVLPISIGIVWINQQDDSSHFFLHLLLFLTGIITAWMLLITPAKFKFFTETAAIEEGPLTADITDLAKTAELKFNAIFKIQTAKTIKLRHNTGYITSIGNTKYLLLDQKLFASMSESSDEIVPSKYTNTEILSIVAHEIGHWYHSHSLCDYLLMITNLVLLINIYMYWYDDVLLYREFGFEPKRYPIVVGIYIVYFYILVPYNMCMNIINFYVFRRCEYEADRYAACLVTPKNLINLLAKSTTENMEFPVGDAVYSIFFQTQPNLMERIKALRM